MAQGQEAEVYQRPKADDRRRWFALRVQPQKEILAKIALQRMGFEVRFPERENWRHANHYTARRKKKFPLLTAYIFVGFRKHQVNLDYMRRATKPHFVGKFLGVNGYPIEIAGEWLAALDSGPEAVAKLYQKKMRTYEEYDIGDVVKITDGPFAGFEGIVEDIDEEHELAHISVDIFGRLTPVRFDVGQAVRAA